MGMNRQLHIPVAFISDQTYPILSQSQRLPGVPGPLWMQMNKRHKYYPKAERRETSNEELKRELVSDHKIGCEVQIGFKWLGTIEGSEFESRWCHEISLLHVFQTGSGSRPVSYTMGTGGRAAEAWSWPLNSKYCRGQENVKLDIHSPIRLLGVELN
jgi:hypothetical protein